MRCVGRSALVLLAYTLLTLIFTYPLARVLTTHIPFNPYISEAAQLSPRGLVGGVGDHWVFLWGLGFFGTLLPESWTWSLTTDAIFYPRGVDLTYPALLGFGVPIFASIPLARSIGLIPAYNVLIASVLIAAAYTTFCLVRYLLDDWEPAFLSGVIFAFAPYQMGRAMGHLNILASAMWIPLFVLFFIKGMKSGRWAHLLTAAACLSLTVVSNPYYAVFLGVFAVVYVLYHAAFGKQGERPEHLVGRAGVAVAIGPLPVLLLVAGMALKADWSDVYAVGPAAESFIWGADLLAFFIPSRYHPLWGDVVKGTYDRFASNYTEQSVFAGWVVLGLAVAGALAKPRETRFWVVCALAFFVLALGPFLHVGGQDTFTVGGVTLAIPLPSWVVAVTPGLKDVRVASRWFVMLLLALAILAGYGAKAIARRGERSSRIAALWMGALGVAVAFEYLCAPLPVVDARIPALYEDMGRSRGPRGTVLDAPLDWRIFKYEYYQTAHGQRLLLGQAPRLSLELVTRYADGVPFVRLFKDPRVVGEYERAGCDRRDARRFVEFFDVTFIVLHRQYLDGELFERLQRFLVQCFPVRDRQEDGGLVALSIARGDDPVDLWMGPEGYRIDFGLTEPGVFLLEGWWPPERWGGLSAAWSRGRQSRVGLYLPRAVDLTMGLRLLPFTFPGAPRQGVQIHVNDRFLAGVQLDRPGWETHAVAIPATHVSPGFNRIRFVYTYTAAPADVVSGSRDQRSLAVAYQFIDIRPASDHEQRR